MITNISIIFIACLIILIALSSQFIDWDVFSMGIIIVINKPFGMCPLIYMPFSRSIMISIQDSLRASNLSIVLLSGSVPFPFMV